MRELKFGLTYPQGCAYLPDQQERLLITLPEQPLSMLEYQQLIEHNFRRSGDQVYAAHCTDCQACQSVRLDSLDFTPSASQKRLLNKATRANWQYRVVQTPDEARYYPLYQAYISAKHREGGMWPTTEEQMCSLWQSFWQKVLFLEQYLEGQLVGVTILDTLTNAYSAVYSFYQWPHKLSFGQLAILALMQCCKAQNIRYLYLGYYVENSAKMNYKAKFRPQQRFFAGKWHRFG